jgi:hypothetical protein
MNDQTDLMESNEAPKAKAKPGPKPKAGRPPQKSGVQASRVSYKDRRKTATNNRDPNFHYRIFNADDEKYAGRLEQAQQMGYIYANDGETLGDGQGVEASSIGSSIGTHVGHGTRGVLMKIPKEYYQEDQAAKQAEVDQSEMGMVDDELRNASDMYGEGLKVADKKGTRLEMKVR